MAKHERLDRYELLQVLGDGGTGVVYKAYDPVVERLVAIKTVRDQGRRFAAARSTERCQRLEREAALAKRLTHPNIVPVHHCICHPSHCYLVMEFVEGQSLGAHLRAGHRFTVLEIHWLMHQLLGALGYAHRHGVVHGDIKPENLLVTAAGALRVADFGTARIDGRAPQQPLPLAGTPSYMAPEQCLGRPAEARTDIFSAGVILYQLLTGDKPFTGSSARMRMYKVLHAKPADPSRVAPRLPGAIGSVTLKALAKRTDERYVTARAFDKALTTALASSISPCPTAGTTLTRAGR